MCDHKPGGKLCFLHISRRSRTRAEVVETQISRRRWLSVVSGRVDGGKRGHFVWACWCSVWKGTLSYSWSSSISSEMYTCIYTFCIYLYLTSIQDNFLYGSHIWRERQRYYTMKILRATLLHGLHRVMKDWIIWLNKETFKKKSSGINLYHIYSSVIFHFFFTMWCYISLFYYVMLWIFPRRFHY